MLMLLPPATSVKPPELGSIGSRVPTKVDSWNSTEVRIFTELFLLMRNSAEFYGIWCAKFRGIPLNSEKKLPRIPEEIPLLNKKLFMACVHVLVHLHVNVHVHVHVHLHIQIDVT
jgi:hypothetical protein